VIVLFAKKIEVSQKKPLATLTPIVNIVGVVIKRNLLKGFLMMMTLECGKIGIKRGKNNVLLQSGIPFL
jgi:hypothetical protein